MKPTVYLIGGTTEANLAASRLLADGYRVVTSVATGHGGRLAVATETDAGRKDAAAMAAHAAEARARLLLDCSHPYATGARHEARRAAELAHIPYLRFCRPAEAAAGENAAVDWGEAVERLKRRGGRALLTVGVRHLHLFAAAGLDFAARILPLAKSLAECRRLEIDPRDIIAAHPPFSEEFNRACIRHAGADILVTKDSGAAGGLPEKLAAARKEGIKTLVIVRPPEGESGSLCDLDELVDRMELILADGPNGQTANLTDEPGPD